MSLISFLTALQVSLLHARGLPALPSPTTLRPVSPLSTLPLSARSSSAPHGVASLLVGDGSLFVSATPSRLATGLGFTFLQQASRVAPAESGSACAYGRVIHLRLLSTSPLGDAVAFGCKLEAFHLERTRTAPTTCACRRTASPLERASPGARRGGGKRAPSALCTQETRASLRQGQRPWPEPPALPGRREGA